MESEKKMTQSKSNLHTLIKQESQTYTNDLSYKLNRKSVNSSDGLVIDKDIIESGTVCYFRNNF